MEEKKQLLFYQIISKQNQTKISKLRKESEKFTNNYQKNTKIIYIQKD
jgi:hypothetical protein